MAPPAQRIKLDRKALREPDEFQTLTGQVAAWAETNRTALIAVGIAAVAIAAVGAGVSWYRGRQATAAAVRFQSAHDDFQGSRWTEAADAFAGLGRDYGGTSYGRLATLYEGHALLRKPDPAAAATAYGEYLAASPPTEYLRQEALVGLGRALEANNDATGAQGAYAQAAEIAGPFKADAQLSLARLYEAGGQPDKARELYQTLEKDSPSGFVRSMVEAKVPADANAAAAGGETK
jgi:predicted negative regulator of RcsB-dependent stress response